MQLAHTTGFPVPVHHSWGPRLSHQTWPRIAQPPAASISSAAASSNVSPTNVHHGSDKNVQPVFRAAPYRAEEARRAEASPTARILFVDEGNACRCACNPETTTEQGNVLMSSSASKAKPCTPSLVVREKREGGVRHLLVLRCRSVLAEAIFKDLLARTPLAPQLDVTVEAASIGPAGGREHDPRVAAAAHAAGLTLGPRVTRVFDELVDIVNVDLVLAMDRYDADEVGARGFFVAGSV